MIQIQKKIISQLKSIQLNRFDKIAISIYLLIIATYILSGALTILTLGGLLLMGGAFFTYKGKIFLAVLWYLIADVCWIINAFHINDFHGVFFITVGIIFGALASIKMKNGDMDSELKHKVKDENTNN